MHDELNHLRLKIKEAYQNPTSTFDDLVKLKYGQEPDAITPFLLSTIAKFKNKYDNMCEFVGIFIYISWLVFSPKKALKMIIVNLFSIPA